MARKQAKETPEIAGRPARVKDGRIGRLGWKGQTANSEDFVLNACAVEVGLEVPGHSQAITPQAPRYKGPGLDLSGDECASLVAYVRSLPRPVERLTTSAIEARFLGAGKAAFAKVGCAGCHVAKLGEVEGLYSDLLIHDMGDEMADSGSYDGSDDGTDEPLVPLLADNGQPQQAPQPPQPQRARLPRSGRRRARRNGGRRRCGDSATPARTFTTAGPRPWSRPSPSTEARPAARRSGTSSSRRRRSSRSRRSSSRWSPRARSPRIGEIARAGD